MYVCMYVCMSVRCYVYIMYAYVYISIEREKEKNNNDHCTNCIVDRLATAGPVVHIGTQPKNKKHLSLADTLRNWQES